MCQLSGWVEKEKLAKEGKFNGLETKKKKKSMEKGLSSEILFNYIFSWNYKKFG